MGKTREDSRPFVNVADFGNPGDGIGSAHQAFLEAIDVARSWPSAGNVVYAPEGLWLCDGGAIPIHQNLEYRGAGIGRTILRCAGATTAQLFQSLAQATNVRAASSARSGPTSSSTRRTIGSPALATRAVSGIDSGRRCANSRPYPFGCAWT